MNQPVGVYSIKKLIYMFNTILYLFLFDLFHCQVH